MKERRRAIAGLLRQLPQAAFLPRAREARPGRADPEPPRLVPEYLAGRPQLAARVRGLERGPPVGERLQQAADLEPQIWRHRHGRDARRVRRAPVHGHPPHGQPRRNPRVHALARLQRRGAPEDDPAQRPRFEHRPRLARPCDSRDLESHHPSTMAQRHVEFWIPIHAASRSPTVARDGAQGQSFLAPGRGARDGGMVAFRTVLHLRL